MDIKHLFTSGKPDPADTSLIKPTDWNASHVVTGAPDDWIWTPGSDPYGLDDEFDDASLDAAWTRVDPAGAGAGHLTWTEARGALSAAHNASADGSANLHALLKSLGGRSYPITIQTAVRYWVKFATNYQMLGLLFANGATPDAGVQIVYMPFANTTGGTISVSLRPYINFTADSQGPGNLNPGNWPLASGHATHLKLVWSDANTFDMYTSPNGVDWLNHGQRVYTLSPTHAGLLYSNWGAAVDGIGVYEYFRVS